MKDERFESLSEEVKAKVAACKTADELHALAKSEGVELSLDDLDAASGGWGDPPKDCTDHSCYVRDCSSYTVM